MKLFEKELKIPRPSTQEDLLGYFQKEIDSRLSSKQMPVRFAVTKSDKEHYYCELGVLEREPHYKCYDFDSIFTYKKRSFVDNNAFNVALIIPTGIDAELGGDSGDAGATARLIAASCDTLITHPNVVNAADINELPDNGLYIEGSVLSRLLMGSIGLQKVNSNRILLVIDDRSEDEYIFCDISINAASSARVTLGVDCEVIKLNPTVTMKAFGTSSGRAAGAISNIEHLVSLIEAEKTNYDAIAISSVISVPLHFHTEYFKENSNMQNMWGGVEAMLTHAVSSITNMPSAHSPMIEKREVLNLEISSNIDPRKAPESTSAGYLHCILKGLHKSPKIITDKNLLNNPAILSAKDINCIIIPDNCIGLPVLAALEQGITVIAVKENKNKMKNNLTELPFTRGQLLYADNYLEAAGMLTALKSGISLESVSRPIKKTSVKSADNSSQASTVSQCSVSDMQPAKYGII